MRKTLAAAAVGALSLVAVATSARAATADSGTPWTAPSYQTASASGSWYYTAVPIGLITWYLQVNGTLTNTGSGCYHVVVDAYRDTTLPIDQYAEVSTGARCGAGTATVSAKILAGTSDGFILGHATAKICQGAAGDNSVCGTAVKVG
jgi:hypothetical protein